MLQPCCCTEGTARQQQEAARAGAAAGTGMLSHIVMGAVNLNTRLVSIKFELKPPIE